MYDYEKTCQKFLELKLNSKRAQQSYAIEDNDYWLNADDKQLFYVIPENILVEKGYIGYTGIKN